MEELWFLLQHYKSILATVEEFLRHEKDIEEVVLLGIGSDKAVSYANDKGIDTDTNSGHDEDCYCGLCKCEPSSCFVKTT
jgi:hypothetical protein